MLPQLADKVSPINPPREVVAVGDAVAGGADAVAWLEFPEISFFNLSKEYSSPELLPESLLNFLNELINKYNLQHLFEH